MSGGIIPRLSKPLITKKREEIETARKTRRDTDWEGIDEKLFELLRSKRRQLAEERSVPAYIIFGDKTLKDMARLKPAARDEFAAVFGVGEAKLAQYGDIFMKIIREFLNSVPEEEGVVDAEKTGAVMVKDK